MNFLGKVVYILKRVGFYKIYEICINYQFYDKSTQLKIYKLSIYISQYINFFYKTHNLPHLYRNKQKKTSNKIKWIEVAREFYDRSTSLVFRNEKTCREHWISHLDPTLNK